jgi:hypothetical protein
MFSSGTPSASFVESSRPQSAYQSDEKCRCRVVMRARRWTVRLHAWR